MKRFLLPLLGALLLTATAHGVGFTVSGSTLRDANGNAFIPKGLNNPHAWFDTDAYNALTGLANRRTNCIRVVWTTSGSAARLDQVLSRVIALKMIPMVELHDATGSDSASFLNSMANYWARSDVAAVLKKHERYLLINIANEWGSHNKTEWQWKEDYKPAISILRNAGFTTTLVIDGPGWGQNGNAGLWYGQELLNYDPRHNLLFSIHMYGSWNNAANINSIMSAYKSANLPLVIGEFGYNYNNGNNNLGSRVDHRLLMQYANQYGYGYLAWSTKGNNAENAWLDMSTDWTNLTWWGNEVFYHAQGIYNTARQASVFSTTGGGTGGTGGSAPANGTFRIVNRNSGKALDAYNAGAADGTQIIQWTYSGGNNQRWTLQNRGSNQYSIIGVASGKALEVNGASTSNGAKVQLWTYGGGNHQRWTFTATSSGFYRITPVHATGSALDVNGASTADGALVQLWTYGGGNNQQWSLSTP